MFNKENAIEIALKLIKKMEGFRAHPYRDSAGILTVGYGTTQINGKKIRDFIFCTEEQATVWLKKHLENDCDLLKSWCVKNCIALLDHEAASILSFVYNAGFESFSNSSMAQDILSSNFSKASEDFLKWNKVRIDGKFVVSKGLSNRRISEEKCFIDESKC